MYMLVHSVILSFMCSIYSMYMYTYKYTIHVQVHVHVHLHWEGGRGGGGEGEDCMIRGGREKGVLERRRSEETRHRREKREDVTCTCIRGRRRVRKWCVRKLV